jgi:hypothetical protein
MYAGITTISGAHATRIVKTAFPFSGRKNVIIPIIISGIDQAINFLPPYLLKLYLSL